MVAAASPTDTRLPATTQQGLPLAPDRGTLRPLGGSAVVIESGFWANLQHLNATTMIRHAEDWMEQVGWIGNFDAATAGRVAQERRGREFSDSDVYKLMEAMAWEIGRTGDDELDRRFRALAARILPAQGADGYINTNFGRPGQPGRYSDFEWGHELYCYGHLFQAAVARLRTSGPDEFTAMAIRTADHVCSEFGVDGRQNLDGHPEIETALVELSRATGNPAYRAQAKLFVERRGHHTLGDIEWGRAYFQDEVPVDQATVARGHAVRAMYLAAGAADLAVDLDDAELLRALIGQAQSTLARRTYVTGGMGARHTDEAFGDDFQLPPDRAYSETCAGIGAIQFFQRLLLATGDPQWADHIERTLFNVVATSPAQDGRAFFYTNTLHRRELGEVPSAHTASPRADSGLRAPWYDVSCCPTNVARTVASLNAYLATASADGVQLNQYAPGTVEAQLPGGWVRLRIDTDYPARGIVRVHVDEAPTEPWELALRVPGWAEDATLDDGTVGASKGASVTVRPGYARVTSPKAGSVLTLNMPVAARWIWPDPRIDAVRGQAAVQRGPVVYCLESADLGADVSLAAADASTEPVDGGGEVTAAVRLLDVEDQEWPYRSDAAPDVGVDSLQQLRQVRLVPYHSWANRGPTTMRVWIPVDITPASQR